MIPRDGIRPAPALELGRRRATSRGRALVSRLLTLVVLAAAVWVVARNVSWHDTLLVDDVRVVGELEGDWRAPEVLFHATPPAGVEEGARVAGLPPALAEAVAAGATLTVSEGAIRMGGEPLALGTPAPRIAWSPGIPHTLAGMRPFALAPAFLALVVSTLFVVTRWWRLLVLEGCSVRWSTAFRFTYIGLFFNSFIPGLNGGDVARAVAVVREEPENRSSALMTVIVDRAFGLIAMVLVATAVVLTGDERLDPLKLPVGAFCAAMLVGLAAYVAPGVRRLLRVDDWLPRLPHGERLARLDASARRLLGHPGEVALALLLSLGNHAFNALAVIGSAHVLGSRLDVLDWLAVMTIANTLAALPISPGGLGVGEVLFGSLSSLLGGSYVVGVATCLLYRLELLGLAALGGLVMVLGGRKLRAWVAEARRTAASEV